MIPDPAHGALSDDLLNGHVLSALLEGVRAIAGAGPVFSMALAGAGALLLLLGFRAYRPCAALLVAACSAWLLIQSVHDWQLTLPASPQICVAAAGLLGFAFALVAPGIGVVVALGGVGAIIGLHIGAAKPSTLPTTLAVGAAIGALIPALFYGSLPAFIPSAISAFLIALGGWAFVEGQQPTALISQMPAPWLLASLVLALSATALQGPRLRRARLKTVEAKAKEKGKKG